MKRYVVAALIVLGLTTVFVIESFYPTLFSEASASGRRDDN